MISIVEVALEQADVDSTTPYYFSLCLNSFEFSYVMCTLAANWPMRYWKFV